MKHKAHAYRRGLTVVLALLFASPSIGAANANEGNNNFGLAVDAITTIVPLLAKPKKAPPAEPAEQPKKPVKQPAKQPAKQAPAKPKSAVKRSFALEEALPPRRERRFVAKEVLVETRPDATPGDLAAIAERHRLTLLQSAQISLLASSIHRFGFSGRRTVAQVITALSTDPAVRFAQPNYIYSLVAEATGDGIDQYDLAMVKADAAHRVAKGAAVRIAVIDTGIAQDHPDLAGSIAGQFDRADDAEGLSLDHGTAVAGILAARGRLTGVAPAAVLLSARAFTAKADGTNSSTSFIVIEALEWAAGQSVRLVNMSFAGPKDPLFLREITAARARGILSIAAAGNGGPKAPPAFPAADPAVIAVTAVDDLKRVYKAANRGRYVAIAAPGVDILVAKPGGGYGTQSGTSMATAQVTGVAALALEIAPQRTIDELTALLTATAEDLGAKGVDPVYGAGLIDAFRALGLDQHENGDAATVLPASAPAQ